MRNVTFNLSNGTKVTIEDCSPADFLSITQQAPNTAPRQVTLDDVVEAVGALCARNQRIPAIKLVRTVSGMGLRDAKDYVDRYWPAA